MCWRVLKNRWPCVLIKNVFKSHFLRTTPADVEYWIINKRKVQPIFHLWTYWKTVKVSETYWVRALIVISWMWLEMWLRRVKSILSSLKRIYCDANLDHYLATSGHIWKTKKETQNHKLRLQYLTLSYKFHLIFMKTWVTAIRMKQTFFGVKFIHLN